MNNTLIDNSSDTLKLISILKECIKNQDIYEIMIATGYWDLPGITLIYDELKEYLSRENISFKLLIGKEPLVRTYQQKEPKTRDNFPGDYIKTDINNLQLVEEYQKVVDLLLDFCNDDFFSSKFQIKIYGQGEVEQFLHAKCYIFNGIKDKFGIIGSSNFTKKGLEDNAELNYLETSRYVVNYQNGDNIKGHIGWFQEKWKESVPWNKVFIEEILIPSPIGIKVAKERENRTQILTPYEFYIKLLQDKFGALADANTQDLLESYLPQDFQSLDYQIEAVQWCHSIMQQHGGFILGDVVGLGKTIVGVLLIKYFMEFAGNEGRSAKVLIVTPPAIKSSWIETIEKFDVGHNDKMQSEIDFITTGSINNLTQDITETEDFDADAEEFTEDLVMNDYGLILIDESHKFRNNNTQMYNALEDLINNIFSQKGYYPYIGLLSATPQNNRPEDLKNQIYLFQRNPKLSTFEKIEGRNLEAFFADIERKYRILIREKVETPEEKAKNRAQLQALSNEIRDKVLSDILVRRTRTDVKNYSNSALEFPEIIGPVRLEYLLDDELAQLFYDTMNLIAPTPDFKFNNSDYLCYYRYRATEFLNEKYKERYKGKNMTPEKSSERLAKIMQILLVKRLESSFTAFRKSLQNLQRYTQNMITMFENDCVFICPQIDVNAELDLEEKKKKNPKATIETCFNDIRNKISKLNATNRNEKGQNAEYRSSDLSSAYIQLLKQDKDVIDSLVKRWLNNEYDPKLDKFKESLNYTLFDKEKNQPQKLVIFSEAIDTVDALERAVKSKGFKPLKITSANRKDKEGVIRENFDANYKGEWKNDFDTIITTEVLAEGINLHRANTILNYDTPWNATRLIQRIGRVNRIGSKEKNVFVYNFYPSAEGDHKINLVQNAFTKLQSFHTLFGEDSQIFSEDETLAEAGYSHLVEGEETPYQKFIAELKAYKEDYPERYDQLLQLNSNLQTAFNSDTDEALFVIKTDNNHKGGLYVALNNSTGNIIPAIEMMEKCKCSADTQSIGIPLNIEQLHIDALQTYNSYVQKLQKSQIKNQQIIKAQEVIQNWINADISAQSKSLLNNASRLVKKGNMGVASKINKIASLIGSPQQSLFEITQAEIDNIIAQELNLIGTQNTKSFGKPYIYAGAIKTQNS